MVQYAHCALKPYLLLLNSSKTAALCHVEVNLPANLFKSANVVYSLSCACPNFPKTLIDWHDQDVVWFGLVG